jgi:hypothetical protein
MNGAARAAVAPGCGTMRRMIAATRFGRPLPAGGCIGVPAPACPWENRSDLLRGVEW